MGVDSEMAMNDIGIDDKGEVRAVAKEYFMELLQEHLDNSTDIVLTEYFDAQELAIWGFVAGYEACLKKQLVLQPA